MDFHYDAPFSELPKEKLHGSSTFRSVDPSWRSKSTLIEDTENVGDKGNILALPKNTRHCARKNGGQLLQLRRNTTLLTCDKPPVKQNTSIQRNNIVEEKLEDGMESKREEEPQTQAIRTLKTVEIFLPWETLTHAEATKARAALERAEIYISKQGEIIKEYNANTKIAASQQEKTAIQISKQRKERENRFQEIKIAPCWENDFSRLSCSLCSTAFSFFNARHHCRNCGKLVDQRCSEKTIALPKYGFMDPVRVCDPCFQNLVKDSSTKVVDQGSEIPTPKKISALPHLAQLKEGHFRLRAKSLNTPVRPLAQSKLMEQLVQGGSQTRLRSSSTCVTTPPTHRDRPISVLDELRNSLKKRNSNHRQIGKRRESVDQLVERTTTERLRRIASDKMLRLQPKEGTAIAQMLRSSSVEQEDSDEDASSWE